MNKEIIEFPYTTDRRHIRDDKPITEFKIHYYYSGEVFYEKDVYQCFANSKENLNAVGYLFSVERLHSDEVKLSNERNQEYLEAYMDAAREVFFNSEKEHIEKYFDDFGLEEKQENKVRIDEILLYKAFVKSSKKPFNEDMFNEFKNERDFTLVIFIEDTKDAERNGFNSEHMKVLMMLERHFFPIKDTDEFYISKQHLEFKSNHNDAKSNESDKANEEELQKLIIKSISKDIKDNDLNLVTEVLPEFYCQSYSIEYIKFSILYQYVEIFIGILANKFLEDVIRERDEKNLYRLKSEINDILSEKYRIKQLFTNHSSALKEKNRGDFEKSFNKILSEISPSDNVPNTQGKNSTVDSQLYWVRNVLYHNLRLFNNKKAVDEYLKCLNVEFEKIVANILTTFNLNGIQQK